MSYLLSGMIILTYKLLDINQAETRRYIITQHNKFGDQQLPTSRTGCVVELKAVGLVEEPDIEDKRLVPVSEEGYGFF